MTLGRGRGALGLLAGAWIGGAALGREAAPMHAVVPVSSPAFEGAVDLYTAVGLDPVTLWETHPAELGGVIADGSRFYAALRRGVVEAYDAEAERALWWRKVPDACEAAPRLVEGRLFVETVKGTLQAFEAQTGKALWIHEFRLHPLGPPAVEGSTLFVQTADDTLFALGVTQGGWLWQYHREGPARRLRLDVTRTPAVTVKDRVFAGFGTGHMAAFAESSGALLWERRIGTDDLFPDVSAGPVLDAGGGVMAAAYRDGLYRVKQDTGELVWTVPSEGTTHLRVIENQVLASQVDGTLEAYSIVDGKLLWKSSIGKGVPAPGVVWGRTFYYGDSEGVIRGISLKDGKQIWSYRDTHGFSSAIGRSGKGLFGLTNYGVLEWFE